MQEAENQVQWPNALPTMRKSLPGVRLCPELLQWIQRLGRIQANYGPTHLAATAGRHAVFESELPTEPRRYQRLTSQCLSL